MFTTFIGLCLFGAIAFKLFSYAEDDRFLDLAKPTQNFNQIPIDFVRQSMPGHRESMFALKLVGINFLDTFAQSENIALLLGTHSSQPSIIEATIHIADTSCFFDARQKSISDNQLLGFYRRSPCVILKQNDLELRITLKVRDAPNLSLWTLKSPRNTVVENKSALYLDQKSERFYALGTLGPVNRHKQIVRIDKLAYMWGIDDATILFRSQVLSLLACWIIVMCLSLNYFLGVSIYSRIQLIGVFSGLIFTSMGLMAFLSPPLQAPDEPDHFMGYLIATGQKSRINELKEFAKRSHFERIKFRKDEFFRAADVDQPYPLSWGKHVETARIEARSSIGTWVWQKYSSVIAKDSGIGPTILQLRFFNGSLWTFAWICFFIAASKYGRDLLARQLNKVFYLLLIPVIPFFAMHISDFSLVVPIVVASVLCLGILPHSKSVIIPGVISGLIIQTSLLSNKAGASSLLLFCPLAWHALFCRVGGTRTARENVVQFLKEGSIFWIIAALIAATPFISPHETHIRTLSRELARFYGVFPQLKSFLTIETYLLLGPIICGAALIGYFLLGGIGFSFIQFASQKVLHSSRELAKAFLTLSIGLIAISILYSLVASRLPQLQNIEIPDKPPFLEYERNILKVLLSSLRLTDLDFYLQATFWGGFGWLESMPSPWFLGLQNSLFIVLIIKFVLYWRESNPTYGAVISVTWTIISLLLVSLLAYTLMSRNFNIHGRYLIPVYLLNLGFLLVRRSDCNGDNTACMGLSTKNWMALAYPYFYGYAYLMLIQRYLG